MTGKLFTTMRLAALVVVVAQGRVHGDSCSQAMGRLEEGRILEKSLQALEEAERIYRRVLSTENLCDPARDRAWLLLGKCLQAQGKDEEGRQALQKAAGGEGDHAEEARALLSGEAVENERLELQVNAMLLQLAHPQESDNLVELARQLRALGDPAVPYIIARLEGSTDHVLVTRLAETLIRIGTRGVGAYLDRVVASKDRYLQQVFIAAVRSRHDSTGRGKANPAPFAHAFVPLLPEVDEKTRVGLVALLGNSITKDEALEFLTAFDEPALRVRVLDAVFERNFPDDADFMERLRPVLRGLFSATDAERQALGWVLQHGGSLATANGRALFLEGIVRGVFPAHTGGGTPYRNGRRNVHVAIPAGEILAVAAKNAGLRDKVREQLERIVVASLESWRRDDVAHALRLIRSGFAVEKLAGLVFRLATDEDYTAVVDTLEHFAGGTPYLLAWLEGRIPLPTALPALESRLTSEKFRARLREGRWLRTNGGVEPYEQGLSVLCQAVAAIGTAEAQALLLRVAADPRDRAVVTEVLLDSETASVETLLVLGRLTPDDANEERHRIVRELLSRGFCDAETLLPILRRGVRHLRALFHAEEGRAICGGAEAAVLLRALLEGDDPERWWSMLWRHSLKNFPRGSESLAAEVVEVIYAKALDNPERELRARVIQALLSYRGGQESTQGATVVFNSGNVMRERDDRLRQRDLARRALRDGASDVVTLALEFGPFEAADLDLVKPYLTHPGARIAATAVHWVARCGQQEQAAWLLPCLEHSVDLVRAAAANGIYRLGGDGAIEPLLALTRDPSPQVRLAVYTLMGRSRVERVGDLLLEGLRDEDNRVRATADAALSAIERYRQRRRSWEGRKESFALTSESAAEALLGQARSQAPSKVRIAAIASLGTLGLPETLPHLIELLLDNDASVRRAAEAAVERIQQSARSRPAPRLAPGPRSEEGPARDE